MKSEMLPSLFSLHSIPENLQNSAEIAPLTMACECSEFVAEQLRKQPDLLRSWCEKLPTIADCGNYQDRLNGLLENAMSDEDVQRIVRLFRQREMAALSLLQSNGLSDPQTIFERLSDLAEAVILSAREWLFCKMCQDYGTPMNSLNEPQELLILGMGKLGGRELNFSSDIDLIFTYPDAGETIGGRKPMDNQKFFTRLGQRLIRILDEVTAEGFAYRTDMRLRPFGDSGALVLSFAAMEDYYQEQGRDWERYAMIKAKILGEDLTNINHKYLKGMLRPFVYRRYLDFSAIQSLREMKQKISREVLRRGLTDNIKLGAGGIREIEFIVQAFQLMRGGRDKVLQQRSLLAVLPQISALGLLSEIQTDQLREAYLFLRHTENTLQAIREQQTQILPENKADRQILVQTCEAGAHNERPQNWEAFLAILHRHQHNVRAIFNELIGTEDGEEEENPLFAEWSDILTAEIELADLTIMLAKYPVNSENYATIYHDLATILQEWLKRSIGQRGREVLCKLLPRVMDQIFHDQNYLVLLPRILNIIDKITTRTTYLELLLEKEPILPQLLNLCGQSEMIAEQIAHFPILLDEMIVQGSLANVADMHSYPQLLNEYLMRIPEEDEEALIDALRQFKQSQILRIAAADILGVLPVMKISDHLTFLAEAVIAAVVNLAWKQTARRFGEPAHLQPNEQGFAVIGYGKLGGIELGYNSDLDLVFLYDAPADSETMGGKKSVSAHQFYLKLAQKITAIFSLNTAAGVLYEVDMRLRPSGEAGLLVSSVEAYEQYQKNEAWTWESQALVRARCVYGSADLRQRFTEIRQSTLQMARASGQLHQEICEMREKMYQHLASKKAGIFHLKTDRGGITDIEFIAQCLVLEYAHSKPQMAEWSDNVRIFDSAVECGILSFEEGEKIKNCYTALRNKIHHLNLLRQESAVAESEFTAERAFVAQMWAKLLS